MPSPLHIIIDTREQRPWSFDPTAVVTTRRKLDAGDYALESDDRFVIERKSIEDFVSTMAQGWERFLRELDRMQLAWHVARVIIVEGDLEQLCFSSNDDELRPPAHHHPRLTPQFLMLRIAQLTMSRVSVLFAGNRHLASALALSLFRERRLQIDATKLRNTDHDGHGNTVPAKHTA
jgi:hypothetical protein